MFDEKVDLVPVGGSPEPDPRFRAAMLEDAQQLAEDDGLQQRALPMI
jgi:hypothetical protein